LVFQHRDAGPGQFLAPVVPAEGEVMVPLDGEDAAGRCQPPQQPGGRGGAHAGVSAGAAGIIPYQQDQVRLELHDSPDVAQRPHFIKGRGHQVKVSGNDDFNGFSAAIPLGDAVVHLPDEQKIGFYQVRPGNAGYAERADAQQQGAEKPEYFDGEGHGREAAWQRL